MPASSGTKPVGIWLILVALAVTVQVSLGGITRLTDSGLSITEWKLILGVVPPLDREGWETAFEAYKKIPQYERLRPTMSLEEFQFIYFWEWLHRLWGRLLGFFFGVPLLVFYRQGRLAGLTRPLVVLFALGAGQGLLGWVMVQSGLTELTYVSHLRLAAHFMLAVVLLVLLVWFALPLVGWTPERRVAPSPSPKQRARLLTWTAGLLVLLGLQMTWGAFMAGLKAALFAPTWPTINGAWIPDGLLGAGALLSDPIGVHFVHRSLAYLLTIGLVAWWWRARRELGGVRHLVLSLLGLQVLLGILTTVQSYVPGRLLWFGALHQLVGVGLAVALVAALRALVPSEPTPV